MKKDKLLIIDGNALMHRAWHALPMLKTKDGKVVNAVYGFTSIFLKVLKEFSPEYVAVTFDKKGPTFRHKLYKEYKAGRVKKPQEFYDQFDMVKDLLKAFKVSVYEENKYEADDLIGTIAKDKQVHKDKIQPIVVTGDMDILQLVDDVVRVYALKKGISNMEIYDIKAIKQKYDLTPEQLLDFKALRGDPSDNIKGAKGVGETTATKLIKDFGTIENLYKTLEDFKDKGKASKYAKQWSKYKERYHKILLENKENVFLSKKLVTIITDVPMHFNYKDCKVSAYDTVAVTEMFRNFEFNSLLSRLPQTSKNTMPSQSSLFGGQTKSKAKLDPDEVVRTSEKVKYYLIETPVAWDDFIKLLGKQKHFAYDTESTGLDVFTDKLVGMSFCWDDKLAYYIHFGKGSEIAEYLKDKSKLKPLKRIFENKNIDKYAHNAKFDDKLLWHQLGIKVAPMKFDTMIASYVINPSSRAHGLDHLAFTEFGHQMIPISDLVGKDYTRMAELTGEQIRDYACEDADYTYRLVGRFMSRIHKKQEERIMYDIEMPLIEVLINMELNGVKVDTDYLKKLSVKHKKTIKSLEAKIHKLAGEDFNIASPAQLQVILFDKLGISTKGVKKTKTGLSTAADVLEKLHDEHEIIPLIEQFREFTKLVSTYIDSLPDLVNPVTKRIHTSFNQTVASTGRLSSSDPNVQNIPIRTEFGREIRKAFVVPRGYRFVSADYSQIELRVIASLSNDKAMIESFKKGEDIHKRTAALINDVPLDEVTKEQRYAAKAVNFGIMYGQGPRGLARTAGIPFKEAQAFIAKYFDVRKSVKGYLESIKGIAREKGYTETLYGRRRYVPDIDSNAPMIRAAAERVAVNTPIQGTAADLIKFAMIDVYQHIQNNYQPDEVKMLLQVHDELDFEVRKDLVDQFSKELREIMEHPKQLQLKVPIAVDIEIGKNWGELL